MRSLKTYILCILLTFSSVVSAQTPSSGAAHPNPDKNLVVTFEEIEQGLSRLSKSPPTPDDLRRLYTKCMHAPEGQNAKNWTSDRKLKLSLLLQFYAMTGKLLDPKFDPRDVNNLASLNPPAPSGTTIIPGQDPSQVQDPQQRAAYEKLIEENNKKMDYVALQGTLLNVRDRCIKYIKFYIKSHYNSLEMDEVKQVVSQQLGNDPAVQKLLQ